MLKHLLSWLTCLCYYLSEISAPVAYMIDSMKYFRCSDVLKYTILIVCDWLYDIVYDWLYICNGSHDKLFVGFRPPRFSVCLRGWDSRLLRDH